LKLASDEKIMRIDPDLIYSDSLKGFVLNLNVKKEKNFFVFFGGNISNLGVNEGFVALQYNYLSQTPFTLYGNTYFGKFYSSGFGKIKLDFPAFVPMQLHASYTINKWDYFQNSSFLVEESAPSYLIQRENYVQGGMTLPVSYKGKIQFGLNNGTVSYEYYQDNEFTRFDTADITDFHNNTAYGYYERNSLNRKQYANKGSRVFIKASMTNGQEQTMPGSNSVSDTIIDVEHKWFRIKARIDQYFSIGKSFKYGFMLEGVYSDQSAFSNYASTLLSSPGFEPIPESKTIFRSRFRSPQYGAVGIRTIVTPFKNFDLRLEGFMFKPFKEITLSNGNHAAYLTSNENQYFIGSFAMVYDLNFTQIAFNVNYYDNLNEKFPSIKGDHYTFMFHLGFVLFNQKMLE
jgi:NTE family protein